MDPLKALIRERLHASPAVAGVLEERQDLRDDPAALLRVLEERGLVDELFTSLETAIRQQPAQLPPPALEAPTAAAGSAATGGAVHIPAPDARLQLCFRLLEGRAFLDYLDEQEAVGRELQWHITFAGQRLRSHSTPAAVDPKFDETFFLALPSATSRLGLLELGSRLPMHMTLACRGGPGCRDDPWDAGLGTLVCSHTLEWRHCLAAAGPKRLTVELQGVGKRHQLSVGVLHAEVELRPVGPPESVVAHSALAAQLHAEQNRRAEVMRRVFEDLDRWWADYHELYRSRYIRLFAQTECRLFLPVTSFVTPLEAGRAIHTPYHALRWVALLATEQTPAAEHTEPCWHTFQALWARGHGTMEEKSLLLCSLLLGWSLDAWCCLGTDAKGQPHAWVVVREHGDSSGPAGVACWDLRCAARVSMDDPRYLSSYTSIDMVFNHRRMYVCHSESVARLSFDFGDSRFWLAVPLDDEALEALRLYPAASQPPFADMKPRAWAMPAEAEELEKAIEQRLSQALRAHREAAGLLTRFDEHLSQLLQMVLVGCEAERAGAPPEPSLFEGIVRRVCGPHEVFRAVPVQFNHLRLSFYWPALSDRLAVRELLSSPPPVTFAVRARVVPFPEGVVAAWVVLAGRGRPS